MHVKNALNPIVRKSIATCTRDIILQIKISELADDTKLSHRARNINAINEQQKDTIKLVQLANKWQMNFNVVIC